MFPLTIYSQITLDLKEVFLEAESYFLFEEYKDALPLYQQLLEQDPENDNLNYKIGICYLNDPYLKDLSISYLEKAVKNINNKFKQNSYKERKAPPEALFFLGKSYRINNRLKQAITTYKKFLEILNPEIYDVDLVNEQIAACRNALRAMNRPNYFISENLGEIINSQFSEINPVVSGDESTLVYTKKLRFYDAVFYSKKVDGEWSYPINLTPQFALDGNSYTTGLSYNGDEIFVYRSDGYDGNIYSSKLTGETWSKLKKLNENINTKYWESHASLSSDDKILYFTSNRKNGYGGLDIYKSERNAKGDWGPAVNLGNVVNSKYNEETPFITSDNKTLYFSSLGHVSIGDYDIFYSTVLSNGNFSKPVNIGYPVNTTSDDMFFVPVEDGRYAYYSMYDPDNVLGLNDIFKMEVFSERHPRKFIIKGNTKKDDDMVASLDKIKVRLMNKNTFETVDETTVNEDGRYTLDAIQGNYSIIIEGEGIKTTSQDITIPINNPENEIAYLSEILPEDKEVKEVITEEAVSLRKIPEITIKDDFYEVASGEIIPIKLNLEKNTDLHVEVYDDGELIKSEEFNITKRKFVYKFSPYEGSNLIKFVLTDEEGNNNTREVTINYTPAPEEELISSEEEIPEKEKYSEFPEIIKLAEGKLKEYLENVNWQKTKITDEYELYVFLAENQKTEQYTMDDVDKLFFNYISSDISVDHIYHNLLFISDGNLKTTLMDLNLEKDSIQTSGELLHYLWEQSEESDYSREDLMRLFMNIKKDPFENIELFLIYLEAHATGNLKAVIQDLDIRGKNISTFRSLFNYLITKAPLKDYNRESVYQLLINIISAESMDDFVSLLKQHAGREITRALDDSDIDSFSNPLELIKYLISHSDNYMFDEFDVLDLLLKIVLLNDFDIDSLVAEADIIKEKDGSKLLIPAVAAIGILLLLLLSFLLFRKKK